MKKNIVIVGGGAGGLELATSLGKRLGKKGLAKVILVDISRTHIWKPLLHQIASGSSDPAEHAVEYMAQARWNGFEFRLGTMDGLDRKAKQVSLAPILNQAGEEAVPERLIDYDMLVLSVGSISNDFGIPGVRENCLFLDNKEQAVLFQKQLLDTLLFANIQKEEIKPGQLDVAIIGAGATGVELAAQLHQVTRQLTQYGLDDIDPDRHININILDASPRILPALPEKLSSDVVRELESLGVRIIANAVVTEVRSDGITTRDGNFLPAAIKVWAAGIQGPGFLAQTDLETNNINQVKVNKNLLTTVDDSIFAIGDCSSFPADAKGHIVPPRAQAAHQQASFVARAITRRLKGGKDVGEYVYRDYGALVTLGRYSTVGSLMGAITGSVRVSGYIARFVYLSLYKSHQFALYGWWRTLLLMLSQWLRRTVDPSIKLH